MDFSIPRISISEKEFKEKYGDSVFSQIESSTRDKLGNYCCGCGFSPGENFLNENGVALGIHIVEENVENPVDSEAVVLCRGCHALQHIDVFLSTDAISLCNSSLSQKELIQKCRERDIIFHLNKGNIKMLKKTNQDYIEQFKSNELGPNLIKFIFSDEFNLDA